MIEKLHALMKNIQEVIIGKEKTQKELLVSLLADGHVLIEDVPGLGKTLLAKTLAISTGGTFKRIQFTPDLLPSDITGFAIYNEGERDFYFREGPVFSNFLLADEINRTIPRTQSSLLEAMEERQITTDGVSRRLPSPFLVMATQNPIESTGTFPLPEAQLDRFLMKITMGYPDDAEEVQILKRFQKEDPLENLKAVISTKDITDLQKKCRKIHVSDGVKKYLVNIIMSTRSHPSIAYGGSPRASLHLMRAGQALALLEGREYTIPDDIKKLVWSVLEHRIILKRKDRLEGVEKGKILLEILEKTEVPLPGTGGREDGETD